MPRQQAVGDEPEGERVELLYELLEGAYIYSGDGDWCVITDIRKHNEELLFETTQTRYESIPKETREKAYDRYDGDSVVVHPDGNDTELWNELVG